MAPEWPHGPTLVSCSQDSCSGLLLESAQSFGNHVPGFFPFLEHRSKMPPPRLPSSDTRSYGASMIPGIDAVHHLGAAIGMTRKCHRSTQHYSCHAVKHPTDQPNSLLRPHDAPAPPTSVRVTPDFLEHARMKSTLSYH